MPRVGIKGQTYYNSGTYQAPNWNRARIIRDLTLAISANEVAIKNKGVQVWFFLNKSCKCSGAKLAGLISYTHHPQVTAEYCLHLRLLKKMTDFTAFAQKNQNLHAYCYNSSPPCKYLQILTDKNGRST
jgi:hypothetical protein